MKHTLTIDFGLLIIRIIFGGLMLLNHGAGKLEKLSESPIKFADPIGLGEEFSFYLTVFSEFICALLVLIGVYTRISAIPLFITMFVAFFVVHGGDPIAEREASLIFMLGYLVLIFTGGGRFSVDRTWRK
ncbi:MAG: DoxX family protein [Candidatus Kapaibacteriales bacterium]